MNCSITLKNGQKSYMKQKRFDKYVENGLINKFDDHNGEFIGTLTKSYEKKEKICIICGNAQSIKYCHLIPWKLYSNFPVCIKSQMAPMIVYACDDHSDDILGFVKDIVDELYDEYNIDLNIFKNIDKQCGLFKKAIEILQNKRKYIMTDNLAKSIDIIKNKYGDDLSKYNSKECINECIKEWKSNNDIEKSSSGMKLLAKQIIQNNDYIKIYEYFRNEFVEEFEPEYLQYDFWFPLNVENINDKQ